MIDSFLLWLNTVVDGVAAIVHWLGDFVQRLNSGTLLDLHPTQMLFVIFLLWLIYRITRMFLEIFAESWHAHGSGAWDRFAAKVITLVLYGGILSLVIAATLFFLLALAVKDPVGRLSFILPG